MEKIKASFWVLFSLLVVSGVVVLLVGLLPALSQWGDSFTPVRVITVTAEGKTTATPDLALVSFSVVTQGKDPAGLSESNNQKMTAVMQFVKSQGIADKDAKTTSYDLQPDYQYDRVMQRSNIIGYTLTQTVQVKVRDLSKVAPILGGLAPLGVNQVGGVDFTFDNPDGVTAIARADAIGKAKEKAAAMASEAGASLGAVVTLNESTYLPMLQKSIYEMNATTGFGAVAATPAPVSPGTQDITDNVTIVYELR